MVIFSDKVLKLQAEDKQYHMNSQNDRSMIQLKAIEEEHYYFEN